MIAFVKRAAEKFMTTLVSIVRKALTLFTLFSFLALFVLFFFYMYNGDVSMCFVCLAGICTFIYLNRGL